MRFSIALLLAITLISCSTFNGSMAGITDHKTEFQRLAYGTATTAYFLGIGGNDKNALVLEAKEKMRQNFPLESDEIMSNYTIDFKNSHYLIYSSQKVTVSAEILKVIDLVPSAEVLEYETVPEAAAEVFDSMAGQQVFIKHQGDIVSAKVIAETSQSVELAFTDANGTQSTKTLARKKVYLKSNQLNKAYKIGDKVSLRNTIIKDADFGVIEGIGESQLLIKANDSFYEILAP
ncbi:MAG: DUF6567 family protein [Luteibaculum sp.]